MRRLICAAARKSALVCAGLLLAGCVGGTSGPKPTGTRNPDTPMSSIAVLDLLKLSGRWHEVLAFVPEGKSCVIGGMTFTRQANGRDLTVTEGPCADGAPRSGLATAIGPGRFSFGGGELWVLWVDATYDTAVIGYPSGQAHVLSRTPALPPDRRLAVEGVLSWNGYDLTKLRQARRN